MAFLGVKYAIFYLLQIDWQQNNPKCYFFILFKCFFLSYSSFLNKLYLFQCLCDPVNFYNNLQFQYVCMFYISNFFLFQVFWRIFCNCIIWEWLGWLDYSWTELLANSTEIDHILLKCFTYPYFDFSWTFRHNN